MKNLVTKLATLLCAIVMIGVASCSKDDGPAPNNGIVVSDLKFNANGNGDNLSLSLKTNGNWKIESDSEWIIFSATEGSGNAEISMQVDPNYTYEARTANIKLINQSGVNVRTIPVKQKCSEETTPIIVCTNLNPGSQLVELSSDWNNCDINFAPIMAYAEEKDLSDKYSSNEWLTAKVTGSSMQITYANIADAENQPEIMTTDIILKKGEKSKKVTVISGNVCEVEAYEAKIDNWGLESEVSNRYVKELIIDVTGPHYEDGAMAECDRLFIPIYSLLPYYDEERFPAGTYTMMDLPGDNVKVYCQSYSFLPVPVGYAGVSHLMYGLRHYRMYCKCQYEFNVLTNREEQLLWIGSGAGFYGGKVIVEKNSADDACVYIIGFYKNTHAIQDSGLNPNKLVRNFYKIHVDPTLISE